MKAEKPVKLATITAILLCVCISFAIISGNAFAKKYLGKKTDCSTDYEKIIKLKEPDFDTRSLWSTLYGESGMDEFSDLLHMEDGTVVAAGSFTKDETDKIRHPLIAKIDQMGRKIWETREVTPKNTDIKRILPLDSNGFVVIGNIEKSKAPKIKIKTKDTQSRKGIYIATYTGEGKMKSRRRIFEKRDDLEAKSFIRTADGSYIIAAQSSNPYNNTGNAMLFKISPDMKFIWKRKYVSGINTHINNIQNVGDNEFMLLGDIENEKGKRAGWAVKIDDRGTITWQKTYPRGSFASLNSVSIKTDGGYILSGYAKPLEGKRSSAWIMDIDADGKTNWQRFFTGSHDYEAYDTLTYEDKRSVTLINAHRLNHESRSHARILTLSPRGNLIKDESFSAGRNASSTRMVEGINGERIITGTAQTSLPDGMDPMNAKPYTFDGWIIVTPHMEDYEDPCKPKPLLP